MSQETELWRGTPSQVIHLPVFILCALLCWLVVPILFAIWRWLEVRHTNDELSTEPLRLRHGIINRHMDELELHRVRDYTLEPPITLRIFGFANIVLLTSDKAHPTVVLRAIQHAEHLRDEIRHAVEACRVKKRVREVDFE